MRFNAECFWRNVFGITVADIFRPSVVLFNSGQQYFIVNASELSETEIRISNSSSKLCMQITDRTISKRSRGGLCGATGKVLTWKP